MRIHLVIEDDQGETFKVIEENGRFKLHYCPITEDVNEPVTSIGMIERINFALNEGLNVQIGNGDIPITNNWINYRINYLTPPLFEKMKENLLTHNVSIKPR